MVQLDDLIGVQITDILELILFILLLRQWVLEPQIVSLRFALSIGSILLLPSTDGSDLVDFGTLRARYHLRVLMLDGRVVHDL